MAEETANDYEEIRKQRVQENNKLFADLGLVKIAKSLADHKKTERKPVQRRPKEKPDSVYLSEPRRSSRERTQVVSYQDEVYEERPTTRKRRKVGSDWASYLARPLHEVKTPSSREIARALKRAEELQSNLTSGNPSFVKTMVRSHVYSCFWLGLPSQFCEYHLPEDTVKVVLEAEDGSEYEANYIGERSGISGGWRGFAMEYKLDAGDAVVFELTEQWRFKTYVVRASASSTDGDDKSAKKSSAKSKATENEVKEVSPQSSKTKKKDKAKKNEVEEASLQASKVKQNQALARSQRASTRNQKK